MNVGMVCYASVGGSGVGGAGGSPQPAKDCGPFQVGNPDCATCFQNGCCSFGLACGANQECVKYGTCLSGCGPTNISCQIDCTTQFNAGYNDYANIVMCMQQACPQCVQG